MKVLIIGCGSIGTVISKAIEKMPEIETFMLFDIEKERAEQLSKSFSKAEVITDLDFYNLDADIMIESACQPAAKKYIPQAFEKGIDAMIMSVGAFADSDFQERCYSAIKKNRSNLLIPSGAIAGIDALKAAGGAKLETVKLTTTKPPKGLSGVKYLEEKGIDVEKLGEKTTLYSGPAGEAVKLFPANVNVAATVSLAGIGFVSTLVDIVCDPQAKVNSHRLFAKGDFGEMEAITRNLPSPDNPRTSYLASLSAVSALRSYTRRIWIGV